MALRLVPYAMRSEVEEGDEMPAVAVNYAATLDPLPDDTSVGDLPDPPAAGLPGAQLQPLALEVVIQAAVVNDENGNEVLTFALGARLPEQSAAASQQPASQEALSPWTHDMSSEAVYENVARIRSAPSEDRYYHILELADAMMAPLDPNK
jgi:hypothetical protein